MAAALVGIGYVVGKTPTPNPANTPLAQKTQQLRESGPPARVEYVPVPEQPPEPRTPSVNHQPEGGVGGALPTQTIDHPPLPQEVDARATPLTAPPPITAVAQESEVDIKRRVGTQEFDRDVAFMARKADAADVAWQRFLEGCRLNVTSITAVAGIADREWLAFAGVNVTTSTWTEACAEAGTFLSLVRQVRDGMCVAEDRARQSWVYPGVRRDVRHRYRLDWEGWDSACR